MSKNIPMADHQPLDLLKKWLDEEASAGAQYARHAVLSTQGLNGAGHGRVVAIREICGEELLFFTQKITRKVQEIQHNARVSLTFWFERHAREVIVEGEARFLSGEDNASYWNAYPKWAQIRFCSYAPTSGLPIENKEILENKRKQIEETAGQNPLPLSPDYYGIAVKPQRFLFYSYRLDELSDVWEYLSELQGFTVKRLSP